MKLPTNSNLRNVFRPIQGRRIFWTQSAILASLILLLLAYDGDIYQRYVYRNSRRSELITTPEKQQQFHQHNSSSSITTTTNTNTTADSTPTSTNNYSTSKKSPPNAKSTPATHAITSKQSHPKAPHEFANISRSTRHNLKHAHPLSPREFADISEQLAISSRPPRMLQPWKILAGHRAWSRKEREKYIPKDAWDAIADDVAIAVKTGSEVAEERLEALWNYGWLSVGRRVPNLLVVADAPFPALGVIDVKRYAADILVGALRTEKNATLPPKWFNRDGWDGDKDKNLPTLHLLKSTFPKAKWYILIDDDTYLFLDNFAKYANSIGANETIYAGRAFRYIMCGDYDRNGEFLPGRKKDEYGVFGHGGSGIFINNLAMNRMFPTISECIRLFSDCYAGDMQVSFCMERVGVKLQYYKHEHDQDIFTMFSFSRAMADSRYTDLMNSDVKPVTFHKIPPDETMLMAAFDKVNARSEREFQYKYLRLYLQTNGIQPVFEERPTDYDTMIFFNNRSIQAKKR